MYSKDQASQLKQAFWTAFGQYIAPQPSADGLKINWINYKTGIRHLYFRMQADNQSAYIAIEIAHPDAGIRQLVFEQFMELKTMLKTGLDEDWDWQLHTTGENGKTLSRIMKVLPGVSVFNKQDWPALISFFKPRITALDQFWSLAQYSFDLFR